METKNDNEEAALFDPVIIPFEPVKTALINARGRLWNDLARWLSENVKPEMTDEERERGQSRLKRFIKDLSDLNGWIDPDPPPPDKAEVNRAIEMFRKEGTLMASLETVSSPA